MTEMMNVERPVSLPRGCRVIDFPQFMDERGGLSFAESMGHVPFAVERVFWLYNLSGCRSRGGHSQTSVRARRRSIVATRGSLARSSPVSSASA